MNAQLLYNFFSLNSRRPERNKRYIINSRPALWSSENHEILITSPRGPYIFRVVIVLHLKGSTSCDLPSKTDGRLALNQGHDIGKLYFVLYICKNTRLGPGQPVKEGKKPTHVGEEDLTSLDRSGFTATPEETERQ